MPKKQLNLFDQKPDHGDPRIGKNTASQNSETDSPPVSGSTDHDLPTSAIERANALREMSYQLKFKTKKDEDLLTDVGSG